MNSPYPYSLYSPEDRLMLEEERQLMREITGQRLSWNKIGKMIKLNALIRFSRDLRNNNY